MIPQGAKIDFAMSFGLGVLIDGRRNYCQQSYTNAFGGEGIERYGSHSVTLMSISWLSDSKLSFYLDFKLLFSIKSSLDKGVEAAASIIGRPSSLN
jgi:hypothetical protein